MPICPTNDNPVYLPAWRLIEQLTNDAFTIVQTVIEHGYVAGQYVRFVIPPFRGMQQINGRLGQILDVTSTITFAVDIDSRQFDEYEAGVPDPVPRVRECAYVIPSGHRSDVYTAAVRNVLT